MKKGDLIQDILLLKKLNNDNFKKKLFRANYSCNILNINCEKMFYTYQLYFDELKDIKYEEIVSYNRLSNDEYYNSLELLNTEIKNKNKILTFPKYTD